MATIPTPIYAQTVKNYIQSFAPADTTGKKTIATAGSQGSRIHDISVMSNDTADQDMIFGVTISSTDYDLFRVKIPLNSGNTNAIPSVAVLINSQFPGLCCDSMGNRFIDLASGTVLYAKMGATVTTAKQINVFGYGGDF